MEAVDAMDAQTLEKSDVLDRPTINPWRVAPSRDQIRYATDLCRSELPYVERVRTIESFAALDSAGISELIDRLAEVRRARLKRLARRRPRRR